MINPDQFYGQGVDFMFPEGGSPVRGAPWPRAGRSKQRQDYDQSLVTEALRNPPRPTPVDPRTLSSTQPSVTEPGVRYYAEDPTYAQTGRTYADQENPGNQYPVVYHRHDNWPPGEGDTPRESLLLSGHHRGSAALAQGRPLLAIEVSGPWGPPRNR